MTIALVQARSGETAGETTPRLAVAPTDGNLIMAMHWGSNEPPHASYTDVFGARLDQSGVSTWGRLYSKIASGTPTTLDWSGSGSSTAWVACEFSGIPSGVPVEPGSTLRHASDNHPHHAFTPDGAGEILIIGAFWHGNTTGAACVPDAGYAMVEKNTFGGNGNVMGILYKVDPTGDGSYDPGLTTDIFNGIWSFGSAAWLGLSGGPAPQSAIIS